MMTAVGTIVARDGQRTARLFHALADATRLRILEQLADGEQCVCDLTDALEAGQSRLSFHLKTLKDAGLVTDRRQGRWIYYALNPEMFEQLEAIVGELKPSRRALRVLRPACD
jgi:ArsR family transcriptional regulator